VLGTVPSNLISFFDFNRFAEYLVDNTEVPSANTAALDTNARAIAIVQAAEGDVVTACRTKQLYTLQVLRDLVRDYQVHTTLSKFGNQILSLIADLAWGRACLRKRYAKDTPQGQDPGLDLGKDRLELLKSGSRIFVIEGMEMTDGAGNVIGIYGGQNEPNAGIMTGYTLRSNIGSPVPLWGDVGRKRYTYEDDDRYTQ
jgi:hypothetical protein